MFRKPWLPELLFVIFGVAHQVDASVLDQMQPCRDDREIHLVRRRKSLGVRVRFLFVVAKVGVVALPEGRLTPLRLSAVPSVPFNLVGVELQDGRLTHGSCGLVIG